MKHLQYFIHQSKKFRQLFYTCHHMCQHKHMHTIRQSSGVCQKVTDSMQNQTTVNWDPGTAAASNVPTSCIQCRGVITSALCGTRSNVGIGSGQHQPDSELSPIQTTHELKPRGVPDTAWAVRLANENGYLSWCRNTYLASAVACGMQAEGAFEVSQLAAQGVFLLAGINLIWGTTSFVVHILQLRRRVHMSVLATLMNISGAILHLLTWLALVTMYLGLTEEEQPEKMPSQGDDV